MQRHGKTKSAGEKCGREQMNVGIRNYELEQLLTLTYAVIKHIMKNMHCLHTHTMVFVIPGRHFFLMQVAKKIFVDVALVVIALYW